MKCLVILMIVLLSVMAQEERPDCRGPWCPTECPPGTYRYSIGCDYRQPEPTCTNPTPETEKGAKICDFQACYCSPPTVRNDDTKECVRLEDCPSTVTNVTPYAEE